ncbi:MAG TPA: ABC transporter permease [Clostridia bacterium]|nr:ABC transporter permease [Clostridia bacterium]
MILLRKNWAITFAYVTIFLVLALLMGGSMAPRDPGQFKPLKLDLVVSLPDQGHAEGEAFATWLEGSGHAVQRILLSEGEAREVVFSEARAAVFLFVAAGVPVKVITDQKSANGYYSLSVAETYFRYLNAFRLEDGSYDKDSLDLVLSQEMTVAMQNKQKEGVGPSESRTAFLASFAYILTLLATTLIPLLSESFAKAGVRTRTTIAPYPARSRVIQMILGSSFIVFGFAALLLTATLPVTYSFFEMGQTGKMLVNCFLYALAVLGMSYVISVLVRSRVAVTAISTVLSLGVAFLSGAFVPQAMLSESVLTLSKVFPLYYFIHANRFSSSFAEMAPDLIAQAGFALAYFILGFMIARFSKRSRKQLAT